MKPIVASENLQANSLIVGRVGDDTSKQHALCVSEMNNELAWWGALERQAEDL